MQSYTVITTITREISISRYSNAGHDWKNNLTTSSTVKETDSAGNLLSPQSQLHFQEVPHISTTMSLENGVAFNTNSSYY